MAALLPHKPKTLSSAELYGHMADLSFRLGWFRKESGQMRYFEIGEMGDRGSQYMGVERLVEMNSSEPQEGMRSAFLFTPSGTFGVKKEMQFCFAGMLLVSYKSKQTQ